MYNDEVKEFFCRYNIFKTKFFNIKEGLNYLVCLQIIFQLHENIQLCNIQILRANP
jgi:hypothetical protein